MKIIKIVFIFILFITNAFAFDGYKEIKNNKNIIVVKDSSIFNTNMIKDKMFLVNYIDPDERDVNSKFMDKIEKLQPNIGSIAILNMSATWLPDFLLEELIKENQIKHPATVFVYDYNKEFVKQWGLKDDSFVVMVFDKNKKNIFYKEGELNVQEKDELTKLLMSN